MISRELRHIVPVVSMLLMVGNLLATHNRAGEITFQRLYDNTYEITIITWTNTKPPTNSNIVADRNELTVAWGDDSYSVIPRVDLVDLPDNFRWNKYVGTHTYPGPGTYEVVMSDPYRNEGVSNFPNPLETLFTIKTTLVINNQVGFNHSPRLLYPPTDKAVVGYTFIHNPGAYDQDADSLSYKLTESRGNDGRPIDGYIYPSASDSLYVNEKTGDLVWDAPMAVGTYNVAMEITEWRNGVAISKILRDIQIEVEEPESLPPVIDPVPDTCVMAGDSANFIIHSSDPDGDDITNSIFGGPLDVDKSAWHETITDNGNELYTSLKWATNCTHIQSPYHVFIAKVEETFKDPSLFSFEHIRVKVTGPPPTGLLATATSDSISLNWQKPFCNNVTSYKIYRRETLQDFTDTPCLTGIPPGYNYQLVGMAASANLTSFTDKDPGLKRGVKYCYRVVPVYNEINPVEGKASQAVCIELPPGLPSLTNVSVEKADTINGKILVAWLKPTNILDTVPGPYIVRVYRENLFNSTSYQQIAEWNTTDLNDTSHVDSNLNTYQYPYQYKVEIYTTNTGSERLISFSEEATSTYMTITSSDNQLDLEIENKVPWIDTAFVIYRKNDLGIFEPVDTSYDGTFSDTGLVNLKSYWYRCKALGYRFIQDTNYFGFYAPCANISHDIMAIPEDKTPPCPPVLRVTPDCDAFFNQLEWTNQRAACADDITGYQVYYSDRINQELNLVETIDREENTLFQHFPGLSMGACYGVTAIDSFNNESDMSNIVCIDSCKYYELPNVFTPNNDNDLDMFKAENKNNFVKEVDMKIFNRYGQLVHETTDPAINWDGANITSGKLSPAGVYYYVCIVYEPRLTGGLVPRTITGFIHLITDEKRITSE